MRKLFLLYIVLHISVFGQMAFAQNYVGLGKDQIKEEMKANYKKFKLNTGTVNPHYNYLKYEDFVNEITILFFLSDDEECTLVRKICAYANLNEVIDELNAEYNAVEKNKWEDERNGETYTIQLTEDEWFFTVTTKLKD